MLRCNPRGGAKDMTGCVECECEIESKSIRIDRLNRIRGKTVRHRTMALRGCFQGAGYGSA